MTGGKLPDGGAIPGYGTPGASAPGDTINAGVSFLTVRADHRHGRESFAVPAIALGIAAIAGTAGTLVRTDATIIAFDTTVPVTQAFGDAAATGAAAVSARRDHKHGMPADPSATFAVPAIALGIAAVAGVATTVIRSDATILAFDTTVPVTQAFGDAAATGSATVSARRDHKHGITALASSADPLGVGAAVSVYPLTLAAAGTGSFTPNASRTGYFRGIGAATSFANVACIVGVANGNVELSVFNGTTVPTTRQQTTGSVACPASGYAAIALGAAATVTQGAYWWGVGADNVVATLTIASGVNNANSLMAANMSYQEATYPAPSPATPGTGRLLALPLLRSA